MGWGGGCVRLVTPGRAFEHLLPIDSSLPAPECVKRGCRLSLTDSEVSIFICQFHVELPQAYGTYLAQSSDVKITWPRLRLFRNGLCTVRVSQKTIRDFVMIAKTRRQVARMHFPCLNRSVFSNYAFHCLLCACFFAFYCLLSLRTHLCTSLCTCFSHASMHFIVYFPCAGLYAFHCLLSLRMHLCLPLFTFPAHASMHLTVYFPCARIYALYSVLALRRPLCVLLSTLCMPLCVLMHFTVYLLHLCTSLCTCPTHASMHFTVYFPAHASVHFTVHFPCACLYAFHCLLSLCISLSTFPTHCSMDVTLYLPYGSLYVFCCALSLCMPLCISLSNFRLCSRSCGDVLRVPLLY